MVAKVSLLLTPLSGPTKSVLTMDQLQERNSQSCGGASTPVPTSDDSSTSEMPPLIPPSVVTPPASPASSTLVTTMLTTTTTTTPKTKGSKQQQPGQQQPRKKRAYRKSKPSTNQAKRQLSADFQPTSYSVICGRGKECFDSEGNKRFRQIINKFLDEYAAAPGKSEKSTIVSKAMNIIREASPEGAFVKCENGIWFEVSTRYAREKVGAWFRDCLHSKYKSSSKAKHARKMAKRVSYNALDADEIMNFPLDVVEFADVDLPELDDKFYDDSFDSTATDNHHHHHPAPTTVNRHSGSSVNHRQDDDHSSSNSSTSSKSRRNMSTAEAAMLDIAAMTSTGVVSDNHTTVSASSASATGDDHTSASSVTGKEQQTSDDKDDEVVTNMVVEMKEENDQNDNQGDKVSTKGGEEEQQPIPAVTRSCDPPAAGDHIRESFEKRRNHRLGGDPPGEVLRRDSSLLRDPRELAAIRESSAAHHHLEPMDPSDNTFFDVDDISLALVPFDVDDDL